MEIKEIEIDGVVASVVEGAQTPDICKTFDCGQCFRFERTSGGFDGEFAGVAYGKAVSFAEKDGKIYIFNSTARETREIWVRYLDLESDYDAISRDIRARTRNEALLAAAEAGRGIRILRQEPFETLCSFILSQNNNIPRIKKTVQKLCERYGKKIGVPNMEKHGFPSGEAFLFPSAEALVDAGVAGIFSLKTGFRAKYLYDAALRWQSGRINAEILEKLSTERAKEVLKEIYGTGEKVACCALLYGFGRKDAFPKDVWIKRALSEYFDGDFDEKILGPYAGVAQQFLFYRERYLKGTDCGCGKDGKAASKKRNEDGRRKTSG